MNKRPWIKLKNESIGTEYPKTVICIPNSVLFGIPIRRGIGRKEVSRGVFHAGFPMEPVHIDILGPITLKTKSGSSYILVMIDQFTKWVEFAALPAQNAEFTVKAFFFASSNGQS